MPMLAARIRVLGRSWWNVRVEPALQRNSKGIWVLVVLIEGGDAIFFLGEYLVQRIGWIVVV